jgi:hypothetical protein
VAAFSYDASPALFGVVQPVFGGQVPRIHAVVGRQRFLLAVEESLHLDGHGRKAPVESHHQQGGFRFFQFGGDLIQLFFTHRQGFFA